jgi:hypothetical protein
MFKPRLTVVALALVVALATTAVAQWPDDPASNLPVLDGPGEQVVPHVAVVPAGGDFAGAVYVGSYHNASGNYDVALQLLTADGVPVFADGSIIVSDEPQNSWVMDWSLDAAPGGYAVLTFADVRDGNSNIQVYMVNPDGTPAWGETGISLTDDADFKGPPCTTVAANGDVVVVWMQSGAETVLRMQRLDAAGNLLLPAGGVVVSEPDDMSPAGNLLIPTDGDDVILAYVPTYSFSGARQIKAQRFDAGGTPVWPSAVWVMDDASLPMGHYFDLTSDGLGGALVCWDVVVGNAFDARVQRMASDGTELLPHNGVTPEAGGPAGQIEPSAVFDPATGEVTMAYIDMNSSQSQRGLSAQRFDADGNRLWGSGGAVLLPMDTVIEINPGLALVGGEVLGVVEQEPGGFGSDLIQAFGLDDAGNLLWGGTVTAASTPSSKGDLLACDQGATMVGVWVDDRSGSPDVYVQNVNPDGTLGTPTVSIATEPRTPEAPVAFAAHPAYPNPFNPLTTIAFDLPRLEHVTLRIFDAKGALVRELIDATLPADSHAVTWDGTDGAGRRQPSGVYYYHLVTGDRAATQPMTLVK